MPDKFSREKRSLIMSQIRGKNTMPESLVFRYLRQRNIYFQKHYKKVLGCPDIALPRKRKAVFIDGDFWHGYDLEKRKGQLPIPWAQKIIRNVKRDRLYRRQLANQGWHLMRVWEHELTKKQRDSTFNKIIAFLLND